MRRTDPRVIRTRQMLRDALIATILDRGYESTNVQDITERAGLRRATFYLHYRDKEELLFTVLRETLDELMHKLDALPPNVLTPETEKAEELVIFQHVQERADLYRVLFSGHGAAEITRRVRDYVVARIEEKCRLEHRATDLPVPMEVLANYLAVVKLNMVLWWLEKNMPYSPEQMAAMCTRLVLNGASGILLEPALESPNAI